MRGSAITRREAVRRALLGAGGLVLGQHLSLGALAAAPSPQAKAKSVIQIWMWGGPSHLDTFDPKPEAGNDYCGPLNKPDRNQRARHPDLRTAAAAGQTGRQVFHHPQHDPRQQRPRNGVLHGADRADAGRAAGLSVASARWFRCSRATTPVTRG